MNYKLARPFPLVCVRRSRRLVVRRDGRRVAIYCPACTRSRPED